MSWNIRGAVSRTGKRVVKDLLRQWKPDVVILVETHCVFSRVDRFWSGLGYHPKFLAEAAGHCGGIWVLVNDGFACQMTLHDINNQVITFSLTRDAVRWMCSAVYASPVATNREGLWDHLVALRESVVYPWMLIGDFNEVLFPSEVRGGNFIPSRAEKMSSMMDACGLHDLGAAGGNFTWHRKENGVLRISKRLDRGIADRDWQTMFPEAFIQVLSRVYSDHCPLILKCSSWVPERIDRPFRFNAAWARHSDYVKVVEAAWNNNSDISSKLERLATDSEIFNRDTFGNIFRRKRWVEGRLRGIQRELDRRITSDMVQLEKTLQTEYREILKQEEILWYQKSREKWVRFGDRNTNFFHAQTTIRRKRSRVHKLKRQDGSWCSDVDDMKSMVQDYFKDLFGCGQMDNSSPMITPSLPALSGEGKATLLADVTKAEVRHALMSMKSFKAPGPDGFQPFFFKKYWDRVGDDLWRVVRDAFVNGMIPSNLAETLVVLIPKGDFPCCLGDFRPISLCNVVYKVVTKVFVNRLRPFLDELVGPLQSSFIPGRGTSDNAILAHEIVHYMHKSNSKKGSLAFKIDLQKAYDSVSWRFLEATLLEMEFPAVIVRLIMCCISSSDLAILWNGARLQSFRPGRGLRQGDPMSPYLFVLCMEKLAAFIHDRVEGGAWKPIQVSLNGPKISHLFFADDILLFCKAQASQVQLVTDVMHQFFLASGLRMNFNKSKAMCSRRMEASLKARLQRNSPIGFVNDLGKYLGFPLVNGRMRKQDFYYILERVKKKLSSWKMSMLNKAGRVCLVKSVISTLPIYSMQIFYLPRSIVEEVDRLARDFVWASKPEARSWHTLRWAEFTAPKDRGGLGVKDSSDANVALLGKLVWALLHHHEKLWVQVLSHKYLRDQSILHVRGVPGASFIWQGILKARDVLREGFQFRLGDGSSSFWYSNWTNTGILANKVQFVHVSDTALRVRDVGSDGFWNFSSLYTMMDPHLMATLPVCPASFPPNQIDVWTWISGEYSAKAGYDWLLRMRFNGVSGSSVPWRTVWKLKVPEKVRLFIWFALHNALPLNERRHRVGIAPSAGCSRCSSPVEDNFHCLRDCPHSRELWNRLGAFAWPGFLRGDFQQWLVMQIRGSHSVLFAAAIWTAWRWRNNIVLDPHPWSFDYAWRFLCLQYDEFVEFLDAGAVFDEFAGLRPRWVPPPQHTVKLNVDGSFNPSNGEAGAGGVVRDENGIWVKGFHSRVSGIGSALLAEATALKAGLELIWSLHFRVIICESDCGELISILQNPNRIQFHSLRGLLQDILDLLNRSWDISLVQVSRDANSVADWLAKYGARALSLNAMLDTPPLEVEALLLRDHAAVV